MSNQVFLTLSPIAQLPDCPIPFLRFSWPRLKLNMFASSVDGPHLASWVNALNAAPGAAWLRKWSLLLRGQFTRRARGLSGRSVPQRLTEITGDARRAWRCPSASLPGVRGGVVPGSIVLVGGDPGIGKSTLLLQMAMEMARDCRVLYVSGEESERQIKMRALRLLRGENSDEQPMPEGLLLVTETNLDIILEHIREVAPTLIIIDSIQTVYLSDLESSAGSISQVRECSSRLRELAKTADMAVFLIGHVTKEGVIAGPRVLEHIVDTVLYLEGDRFQTYRLLRSVKNRFGATSEVGFLRCGSAEWWKCPTLRKLSCRTHGQCPRLGHRGHHGRHPPLLVELQGLTSHSNFGNPRRTPMG